MEETIKRNSSSWRTWALCFVGALVVYFGVQFTRIVMKPSNPKYASYEDCILQNIKDAQSDTAAKLVNGSCRRLYPEYISEKDFMGE